MSIEAEQIDQLLETLRRDCLPAGGADFISAYVSSQRQALTQVHAELAAKPADDLAKACIERLIESGAENYLEHHFVFTIDGEDTVRPATVTVQFKDRPSPHQLRIVAETELAGALKHLDAVVNGYGCDMHSKSGGPREFLARHAQAAEVTGNSRRPAQTEQQKAQGAQAGEFQRVDRYIVIKRTDLEKAPTLMAHALRVALDGLREHLPKREHLVIESDWPEYEPTWAAIQARVTGQGAQVEDEREAFSKWAHEKGFCLDCAFFEEGNNFEDPDTRLAYEIWLARADLATQRDARIGLDHASGESWTAVASQPAVQDDGGRAVGPTHPAVRGAEHE